MVVSSTYSRMSPGWHCNSLHIAARVVKRMALTFPVLSNDKLVAEMPTRCDKSLRDTLFFAISTSRLICIFIQRL